jgi:spore maturation protein CgeB
LLIVGNPAVTHVGGHLLMAARALGLQVHVCDTNRAFAAPKALVKLNWWLRGHRPPRLGRFCREVLGICESFRPHWLLATGLAPLDARTLATVKEMGIVTLNYLTDDPWNPVHRAPWFMEALPLYDYVFTPRRSNRDDLAALGCRHVEYLPFGYNPQVHFPDPPATSEEQSYFDTDVVFAGGADGDRVPWIAALVRAGFKVTLYGGYWERYAVTRACTRGQADAGTLRKAVGGARVTLCLVRRANRDGHAMRSFEIPAMGGCMLTEDTEEHREIFGPEGGAVMYFRTAEEMVHKARWLLDHPDERRRLAAAAHRLIVTGRHTYKDRLATMLEMNADTCEPGEAFRA